MELNRAFKRKLKVSLFLLIIGAILVPPVLMICKVAIERLRFILARSLKIEQVECSIRNVYSSAVQEELRQLAVAYATNKSLLAFDAAEFYAQLKQRFKEIKTVDYRVRVPKTIHLELVGVQPCCVVNELFILADKKRLFDAERFKEFDIQKLPRLTLGTHLCGVTIERDLYDFIHSIPQARWEQFEIVYNAASFIVLTPKYDALLSNDKHGRYSSIIQSRSCPWVILADEASFFDDEKIAAAFEVFEDLWLRGLITKKIIEAKTPKLVFDIRFGNRVLVKYFDSLKQRVGR